MKHAKPMLFLLISSLWLNSCGDDDGGDTASINPENFKVQSLQALDISNNGNASDISVSFSLAVGNAEITSLKLFIVKSTSIDNFDTETAKSLSTSRFTVLTANSSSNAIRLSQEMTDSDGEDIIEGVNYQALVLSTYEVSGEVGEVLTESSVFQINPAEAGVTTLPGAYSSTDGLDGITIDSEGNVYVSNFGVFVGGSGTGSQVFQITAFGQKSNYATGLTVPGGIATDSEDIIYVKNGNNVHKITAQGEKSVYAQFDRGFAGLVFDENNNLYSGGFGHPFILKVTPEGVVETIAEDSRLQGTVGIAYDQESASLYAGNFNTGQIVKVTLGGEVSVIADIGGIGYITEMNGYLYATLFTEHKIAKISLEGEVEIIAGTGEASQDDGALLEATFNQPNGIIGDAENNILYVSDWNTPRVTKIQL